MHRRILHRVVAFACLGSLVFTAGGQALAGVATGSTSKFSVNGVNYTADSSVATGRLKSGTPWAAGYGWIQPSKMVAPGWLGSDGRLFNSSGALVKDGGFTYNSIRCGGMDVSSPSYYKKGTYYAYSIVRAWNGKSYYTHYTYRSPSQNAS